MLSAFRSKGISFDLVSDITDLKGRVYVITGGNRGMGYSTVKHLYFKGAKVYLGARDERQAKKAIVKLRQARQSVLGKKNEEIDGDVIWLPLDLSDPSLAKEGAEQLLRIEGHPEGRLDAIVNNAGVLPDFSAPEDVSMIMMVNYFSMVMFTETLLPLLNKTAQEPGSDVRIVMVSSDTHRSRHAADPNIEFKTNQDFHRKYLNDYWPKFSQYAVSKLAALLYTRKLIRRLEAAPIPPKILCLSVHPGLVDTFSHRLPLQPIFGTLCRKIITQPDEGSQPIVFAVASNDVAEKSGSYQGCYLVRGCELVEPSDNAEREDLSDELWETTCRYLASYGFVVKSSI